MRLSDIKAILGLVSHTEAPEDREIGSGYCSDLLSDVLKNAKAGDIWITNQKHQNCVAVASLLDLSALVIAGGIEPDDNTVEKALAENVALYTSDLSAFELVGRLYEMGVRG